MDPWAEFREKPAAPPTGDEWADFRETKLLSPGEKALDAYKGLGSGALQGAVGLGGFVGDITNLGAKGLEKASNYVADKLGVERYQRPETPSILNNIPTKESLSSALTGALGQDYYKPKSEYGKAAEKVGEFLPGAMATVGTGPAGLLRYGVAPGLATYAADTYLPENEYKPYGVAGAGLAASLVNPSRLVTPLPASAARQASVDSLANEGVTSLTAGERTGNSALRYMEDAASSAPGAGHGAARIQEEGRRQFTDAALRRAGTGGEATVETLAANQRRLGQSFDDLSARNSLTPDNHFINDLVDASRNYRRVPDSQQRQMVQGYIDDIVGHVNNGAMPGPAYQEMRSRLSRQANSLRQSDPTLSEALRDMRNALDNGMARSISPEDAQAWQAARREYAAQKIIEKTASRAGDATLEGQIVPANLRNSLPKTGGGYARGEGDFNELARAGSHVMSSLPNSGTAQRSHAYNVMASLVGGGTGALIGGAPGAAIGAGLGHMAAATGPALVGRTIMSRPVQSYLGNQLLTGQGPVSAVGQNLALIQALQRASTP